MSKRGHTALFILMAATAALSGTTVQPSPTIGGAGWLVGTWEHKTQRGSSYELWTVADDSTYHGRNYYLKGTDTVVLETIRLEAREGKLFYIPTVQGQNNDQPVTFTGTSLTDSVLVFENPDHDFPQVITYTRLAMDSLVAEISGTVGQQRKAMQFRMRRVK